MPGCLPTTIALHISLNYEGEIYNSARAIVSAAYHEARFKKPPKFGHVGAFCMDTSGISIARPQ